MTATATTRLVPPGLEGLDEVDEGRERDLTKVRAAKTLYPDNFDDGLSEVTDPKKQGIYAKARTGLRKWAGVSGKKTYKWLKPKKVTWSSNGLEVNISPELWVEIDGDPHVIKLYFKGDPLSQIKANLILRLMDRQVGKHGKVGVLDVQRGKLYVQTQQPPPGIDALLDAEAAAFALIWDAI